MRLIKVTIENFKGVNYGEISFENERRPVGPSILALYGQNGSGKSALVESLLALKYLLQEDPLSARFAKYIHNHDTNEDAFARFTYVYKLRFSSDELWKLEVIFKNNQGEVEITSLDSGLFNPSTGEIDHDLWVDFTSEPPFIAAEFDLFVLGTKDVEILEEGKLKFLYAIHPTDPSISPSVKTLYNKTDFNIDYYMSKHSQTFFHEVTISSDPQNPTVLPRDLIELVSTNLLEALNLIIGYIVPGLQLELFINPETKNNIEGDEVFLISIRNGVKMPLCNESRGVQKLITIAWLLINVYNNEEFIAVIDEIDAGIFEYLLGEIMRVIAEGGEGQLICTSHNLRPLEVLDKGYIAFTTTNPDNRYIKADGIEGADNLRKFYYRNILFEDDNCTIYEPATNADLAMSFIMANPFVVQPY